MHYSTWFIVCVVISFTYGKKIVPVPSAILDNVRPVEEQCIQESGSIPNILKHMLAWTMPNDINSKKFMECFCIKSGYLDKNGHFVIDKFLAVIKDEADLKEDFVKALNKCNENNGDDLVEFVYEMGECFHKMSPITFSI